MQPRRNRFRRPTCSQVSLPEVDLIATSPAEIGPGGLLVRKCRCRGGLDCNQPRRILRRGLLRFEHWCGTGRGAASPAGGGPRLVLVPARHQAAPAFAPLLFFVRFHLLPQPPPLAHQKRVVGGGSERRGALEHGAGRCKAVLLVTGDRFRRWNGRKRRGTTVNATETGRRGLGTG